MRVVQAPDQAPEQDAILRKVNYRLLPLFWCLSLVCQLDRSNLSFAALQLRTEFSWFSRTIQGLGSGLFFIGYLAQLPANLACVALGARRWLPLILVAWGAVAMSFAAMGSTAHFLALRLLLGLTESGAYPGMYYVLSLFYPEGHLGVAYTWVASATTAAGLLGGPLAAALLSLDGVLGLRGWRWLFLLEGIPPFLLAAALWAWLPASPLSAGFLTPEQRTWLHQWVHGEQGLELAPLPAGPPAAAGLQQHARECEEGSSSGSGSLQRHEGAGEDAADEWGLLLGAGERSTAPAADKSHPATPGAAQQEEHTLLPACAPMPSRRHSPSSSPGGGGAAGSLATDASPAAAAGLKPGLTPPPEAEAGDSGLSRAALRQGLLDRRVWKLGGFMFCIDFGMNACHFWIPSIIRDLLGVQARGASAATAEGGDTYSAELHRVVVASLLAALPFAGAGACMLLNAYSAKRHAERRLHTALPLAVAGCAFCVLGLLASWLGIWATLGCLTIAAGGIWATHGPLFSWPAEFLEPQAGALAFALMKSLGACGGFAGPLLVGVLAQAGAGFGGAMLLLAAVCTITALVVAVFPPRLPGDSRRRQWLHEWWSTLRDRLGIGAAYSRLKHQQSGPASQEHVS